MRRKKNCIQITLLNEENSKKLATLIKERCFQLWFFLFKENCIELSSTPKWTVKYTILYIYEFFSWL